MQEDKLAASPLRIWLLTGHRAGDNAQVRALAAQLAPRLPRPCVVEEKPLSWSALRLLPNTVLPSTLAVLAPAARAALAPPWPDLVIGVGRRSVPVARWIRRHNPACRLVWLGRPRAPLGWFDLLLTTPQYGLPADKPNVVMLDLPPAEAPATQPQVLDHWRQRLAHLPRPWIAVLVGGARWPLLFDAADAARLGRAVQRLAQDGGGSWIVSTSPRTGLRQARALHEALSPPGWFHYWRGGAAARDPLHNPHRALLALADCFVVTADSASMLAEALRSGRRVHMWPLRRSRLAPRWRAQHGPARHLATLGLLSPPRDMAAFAQRLARHGLAGWLKDAPLHDARLRDEACGNASRMRETALHEALERIASWFSAE